MYINKHYEDICGVLSGQVKHYKPNVIEQMGNIFTEIKQKMIEESNMDDDDDPLEITEDECRSHFEVVKEVLEAKSEGIDKYDLIDEVVDKIQNMSL